MKENRQVFISGKPTARIPDFIFKYFGKQFVWMNKYVLNTGTPMGRKFQSVIFQGKGAPLIHISPEKVQQASGAKSRRRLRSSGGLACNRRWQQNSEVSAIVWRAGFMDYSLWLDLPGAIAENGYPSTHRGVSSEYPGLYFVGSQFQYSLTSTWLGGVGRDAKYIVNVMRKIEN